MRIFFGFIILFLVAGFCPTYGLTLSEALSMAASHPALISSSIEEHQNEARALDAGKRGSDRIMLEAENFGGGLPGYSRAETTLSFQRPLLDRRKVRAAKNSAAFTIRETRLETEWRRWQISSSVQSAFHEVLILKSLFDVAREGESLAQKLLEVTKAKSEAGAVPESENLKAQLEVNRAEVGTKKIEGDLQKACCALSRELGLAIIESRDVIGTLSAEITLPSETSLLSHLLEFNPELKKIRLAEESTQARSHLLSAENRPAYSLGGGIRDYRDEKKVGLVFGLEIELPNHKGNAVERQAVSLENQRIRSVRNTLELELKNLLQESISRCETSRRIALDLRNQIIPSSLQILDLALEAYRLGKSNQLTVLEAQKAVLENWKAYFESLQEMYSALNAMEKLCGVCLVQESHGTTISGEQP